MSHLPIWYLGQIPVEDCEKASNEFIKISAQDAKMGKDGDQLDHVFRNTNIRFAEKNHWFGVQLFQFGIYANTICKWNYEIDDFECVQYAEYGIDQKYDWHVDNFPISGNPTDRKITVVCIMSDPKDFDGGELQLRLYKEYVPVMKKGSVIAFPSIIEHRVTPVTRGLRYTSTMWISGKRFK
jgi:PKHD-type hydroxylase